jgi:hypothetical protein
MAGSSQDRRALAELSALERDSWRRLEAAVAAGNAEDAISFAMLLAETRLVKSQIRAGIAFLCEHFDPATGPLSDDEDVALISESAN